MNENRNLSLADATVRGLHHRMRKKEGLVSKVRRRCERCYHENVKKFGSQVARNYTVKVVTFCEHCDGRPHLCKECFYLEHGYLENT